MANVHEPENKMDPRFGDKNYKMVNDLLRKHGGVNPEFLAELKQVRDAAAQAEKKKLEEFKKHKRRKPKKEIA